MKITVNPHKCDIVKTLVNEKEINVTKCEFEFAKEITNDFVKDVYFTFNGVTYKRENIQNNECNIPYEVLQEKGTVEIGVVAYKLNGQEYDKRYNPSPAYYNNLTGSLKEEYENTEPITPTDKEQIEQAITDLQNNKQNLLIDNVNIKTINNESILGTGNLEVVTDLSDYYTKEQTNGLLDTKVDITTLNNYYTKNETYSKQEVDNIKSEIESEIPTNLSSFINDVGYITKSVNNLTNYTTTSEMNTAISNAVGTETTNRQNADIALQGQIDAITSASDVVDVVSTYSDLQSYDTSKLTDKDVIKVMQDSTHSNALSYYRWTVTNNVGSWVYIGSEGPFYTKGETDTLLNTKQATIDSSHKLSADLVDDTSASNKFVTASDKTAWNDKYDKPSSGIPKTDLASAVQTSLGKADTAVQDVSGKEDKSNKVTSISSSSTDTQYPSAKCVYDSQVAQDEALDETNAEVERAKMVYNALPKVTGTGTSITLNDTAKCPMEVKAGSTELEQVTTTGKNLLEDKLKTSGTYYGITFTRNNDGTYTINGTNDGTNASARSLINNTTTSLTLPAGTYYTIATGKFGLSIIASDGTNYYTLASENVSSFTLEAQTTFTVVYMQVSKNNPTTFNNYIIYPMISTTAITSEDYEPYTGGNPAPSPSYPFDIHTISGDNEVVIENKNLLKYNVESQTLNGVNFIVNSDKTITANGTANANVYWKIAECYLPEDGTYYISGSPSNGSNSTYNVATYLHDENGTYLAGYQDNGNGVSFSGNKDYRLDYYIHIASGASVNNKVYKPMISKMLASYEPYTKQTYPITLGDLEVCKIGDYEDEFVIPSDKNLFDGEFRQGSENSEVNTQNIFSKNDLLLNPGTYTFSTDLPLTSFKYAIGTNTTGFPGTITYIDGFHTTSSFTFTLTEQLYVGIMVNKNNNTMTPSDVANYYFQIEKGSTATEYEPYNPDGKWYLKKNIGKVVLDGTQNISIYNSSSTRTVFSVDGINNLKDYNSSAEQILLPNLLCTKFKQKSQSDTWVSGDISKRYNDVDKVYITWEQNKTTSELATLINNMPLYYPLATPEYIPLNDTLQTELNNIEKALSYQDQTNISQTNNDLPFVINASAIRDMSNIFELISGTEL